MTLGNMFDLFRFQLCCCNCNSISNTFEPSLGWSLEIEDVDDLWSALESFTRIEKLEDQLTCDNCKEKVTKVKQLKFDKLPPVATFHLKRFKNDGVTMEKIFEHVEFPLELDLLPFMSRNQTPEVCENFRPFCFVNLEFLSLNIQFCIFRFPQNIIFMPLWSILGLEQLLVITPLM